MEYRYESAADEQPSLGVVTAVAAIEDDPPLALPPLGEVIDASSLDDLFAGRRSHRTLTVSFEYAGWLVTVTATEIRVETPEMDDDSD